MKKLIIIIPLFFSMIVKGQVNIKDSSIFATIIHVNFSYQFPFGDVAKTYGSNSNIGGGVIVKFKSNFLVGLDGNFIFGDKINNQNDIFSKISSSTGYVIDGNGAYTDVFLFERGYFVSLKAGKIFPIKKINPNSGVVLTLSGGFLEHYIRIENPGKTAPQINGDYVKLFDKLVNGFALNEYLGFWLMSDNRLFNLTLGLESTQGFTKSRRDYDINYGGKDNSQHIDIYLGLKISWMIPIYKRAPNKYYYY